MGLYPRLMYVNQFTCNIMTARSDDSKLTWIHMLAVSNEQEVMKNRALCVARRLTDFAHLSASKLEAMPLVSAHLASISYVPLPACPPEFMRIRAAPPVVKMETPES